MAALEGSDEWDEHSHAAVEVVERSLQGTRFGEPGKEPVPEEGVGAALPRGRVIRSGGSVFGPQSGKR